MYLNPDVQKTFMKPFLIILNGPSGSGKSTIAKQIREEFSRTAIIALDLIKWQVSDYKSDTFDLSLASNIGLKMTQEYLKNNINVIVEKTFCQKKYLVRFLNYAKRNNFPVFIYNVEAPWEIIKKRVKKREHKMSLKKAKRIFNEYSDNKFKVDNTFDTSKQSTKQIIKFIKKQLR